MTIYGHVCAWHDIARWFVFFCVATCVLQCVGGCCSVLEGVGVCWGVLQYVAMCCVLQCINPRRADIPGTRQTMRERVRVFLYECV